MTKFIELIEHIGLIGWGAVAGIYMKGIYDRSHRK